MGKVFTYLIYVRMLELLLGCANFLAFSKTPDSTELIAFTAASCHGCTGLSPPANCGSFQFLLNPPSPGKKW